VDLGFWNLHGRRTNVFCSQEELDTVKLRTVFYLGVLFGFLLGPTNSIGQTIAFRQTNLVSNVPNVANNVTPRLANPWGLAFLPGQPFFIAGNKDGHVTSFDATGLNVRPGAFAVPSPTGTGFDTPTGIVADQNSFFGSPSLIQPFIVVTEQGTIFTWGPDAQGDLPTNATEAAKRASAVYKGATILNSLLTAPILAVTDFRGGFVDTFLPGFAAVALPGSFTDPNLPAGYAPFGIQVIGQQVFVTYALQDSAKLDPIFGSGNGIVSIFDMDGNFVRRFTTGGALNAPWGVTQASGNFGPFSNDILIGNVGDGTINAFDPASGRFLGSLLDGDGFALAEVGLHALAFRADGFGDQDTLYFTSQFSDESNALFGAITAGLVSTIRISARDTAIDTSMTITANVAAGPGNPGVPSGTVTFLDGPNRLGTASLINGSAALDATFAVDGIHNITAQYSGDGVFLPSTGNIPLQVNGLATTLTLAAPANANPGSSVTLTATINSAGGIPTGQIEFHDGNTSVGTSTLDDTGVAFLRVGTLTVGAHSLTASYAGDGKFSASTSAAATINIANADFSLAASPASAAVIAGQSTQFMLTVTPAGGLSNAVTFSCLPVVGITCAFSPVSVTPANGAASTTLTVTTSATVSRYGLLAPTSLGPCYLLAAFVLFGIAIWRVKGVRILRTSVLTATAAGAIIALGLVIGGCSGYGNGAQPNRGTASIIVTAQSGTISHSTTVTVTVQ
jgi:uncharacterized protein (TIGR03118 family)